MSDSFKKTIHSIDLEELELEYLGIILTEKGAEDLIGIQPQWLANKNLSKILSIIIDIKRSGKPLTQIDIVSNLNTLDEKNSYSSAIETSAFMIPNKLEEVMKTYEEKIVDEYKVRIANRYEEKFKSKEITLEEYVETLNKIKNTRVSGDSEDSLLNINQINLENKKEEKIKFNLNDLDKYTKGFSLGQLSVWSGSNGGAKSTFLNQLAIECVEQGYNVLVYSGELSSERLLDWIMRQCAGKTNIKWNDDFTEDYVPLEVKEKISNWLNKKMFIYNNLKSFKAEDLIASIVRSIEKNDVKVVFVDNLMSVDISQYTDNKYDAQSVFMQELVGIAQKYKVHIHFVCHPRKVTSFLRKVDISGSGDLTNKADNVFILHRVNNDFTKSASEFYNPVVVEKLSEYTNVLEICKFRDDGSAVDKFVGMYFENGSKRLKGTKEEQKHYGWERNG